jgi:hypothetical protein
VSFNKRHSHRYSFSERHTGDPSGAPTLGNILEVVSKPQITFKGKAQPDEKAEHIPSYVSILKRV